MLTAHATVRPLQAEQLLDALTQVTGLPVKFNGYPVGIRAAQLPGVLPERRLADAVHVAAATCWEADFLVSWNHRHMTRPMKRLEYEAVNRLNGFLKTPQICNPVEACDELRGR